MSTRSLAKNLQSQGTNVGGDFVITTKGLMLSKTVSANERVHRYASQTYESVSPGTVLLMVKAINKYQVEILHNESLWITSPDNLYYIEPQDTLQDKAFCITGKLEYPRDYYATLIKYCGGKFKKAVSRNVDYLVAGKNVGANKLSKAAKYGTTIINEDDFHKLMGLSRV